MKFFIVATLISFATLGALWSLGEKKMEVKEPLPGAHSFNTNLSKKLNKMTAIKGKGYSPRTKHLDKKGWALFTNRLFLESSPYLLQHAHNPVNWYPWSEEAFNEAKKNNRPVLLSVGYSTCHWCHVMEEESFEDLEIARYMNENYIAIKVDREERPDIDSIYMSAVQMMTGRGGWPMTVWLTHDKKPFYGGTYFPPRTGDRGSHKGFLPLLQELKQIYTDKKTEIAKSSEHLHEVLQKNLQPSVVPKESLDKNVTSLLYQQVKTHWDPVHGGMKGAPKFPSSFPYRILLRSYLKTKDEQILKILDKSLTSMMNGGLQDHVGGGFHRYSTDSQWLVPHFEKMLYDQALLAVIYLEAAHLFKKDSYKQTARNILDYIIRDMQSKEGGFYSATDADSLSDKGHKEEGFYFTWTPEELDKALDKVSAKLVKRYYNVSASGNFEGRNIFYVHADLSETAKDLNLSLSETEQKLHSAREKLYQVRNKRALPLRDEKILSAWNGLMISAFVTGYFVLNEKKYLEQAEKSAQFVLNNMFKENQLYRAWKDGTAYIPAYLEDYAFLTAGLLDLFEWTGNINWLKKALELDRILETSFEDKKNGGFFMTADKYEKLLAREKPLYDGAEPSGNAVAALNLLRLAELTGQASYKQRAEKTLKTVVENLNKNPLSYSEWMVAVDFYHKKTHEVVLVLPDKKKQDKNFLFNEIKNWYLPHKVLTVVQNSKVEEYSELLKPVSRKKVIDEKPTVYICEEGACQLPATELEELKDQLKNMQSGNL